MVVLRAVVTASLVSIRPSMAPKHAPTAVPALTLQHLEQRCAAAVRKVSALRRGELPLPTASATRALLDPTAGHAWGARPASTRALQAPATAPTARRANTRRREWLLARAVRPANTRKFQEQRPSPTALSAQETLTHQQGPHLSVHAPLPVWQGNMPWWMARPTRARVVHLVHTRRQEA